MSERDFKYDPRTDCDGYRIGGSVGAAVYVFEGGVWLFVHPDNVDSVAGSFRFGRVGEEGCANAGVKVDGTPFRKRQGVY